MVKEEDEDEEEEGANQGLRGKRTGRMSVRPKTTQADQDQDSRLARWSGNPAYRCKRARVSRYGAVRTTWDYVLSIVAYLLKPLVVTARQAAKDCDETQPKRTLLRLGGEKRMILLW